MTTNPARPASHQLVVASVNTYFGHAVTQDAGLAAVAHADVLLLQEVFNPIGYGLPARLREYGFTLLAAQGHFGLGIALRDGSGCSVASEPVRSTVLQPIGSMERALMARFAPQHSEYSDLGVLAVPLQIPDYGRLIVASTHMPVVTSFRQRTRFMRQLRAELSNSYYGDALIIAGDMNHWPRPHKTDLAFRRDAGLAAVDFSADITWPSRRRTSPLGKRLETMLGGQLDDILYRGGGMQVVDHQVVDVKSDHRGVVATFAATL